MSREKRRTPKVVLRVGAGSKVGGMYFPMATDLESEEGAELRVTAGSSVNGQVFDQDGTYVVGEWARGLFDYPVPLGAEDLAAIEDQWRRAGAPGFAGVGESACECGDSPHLNALHDLAVDAVPALIATVRALSSGDGGELRTANLIAYATSLVPESDPAQAQRLHAMIAARLGLAEES